MRADNLIIVSLGIAAFAVAVVWVARWGSLPVHRSAAPEGSAFASAAWSLAAVLSAGAVAGAVVGGLLARLVMRIAAGVSPELVQGRVTEADENIGEVTFGGTMGIIVFVGLGAGILAAIVYLVARPWLPVTARAAGVIIGIIVMGVIGPADPIDPDNIDFELLSYDSLTVGLILGGAVVFGLAFAALAARFDVAAQGTSPYRWLLFGGFLILVFVPLAVAAAVYLAGRTLFPGKLRAVLERRGPQVAGRVLLSLVVVAMVGRLALVSWEIIRG